MTHPPYEVARGRPCPWLFLLMEDVAFLPVAAAAAEAAAVAAAAAMMRHEQGGEPSALKAACRTAWRARLSVHGRNTGTSRERLRVTAEAMRPSRGGSGGGQKSRIQLAGEQGPRPGTDCSSMAGRWTVTRTASGAVQRSENPGCQSLTGCRCMSGQTDLDLAAHLPDPGMLRSSDRPCARGTTGSGSVSVPARMIRPGTFYCVAPPLTTHRHRRLHGTCQSGMCHASRACTGTSPPD